MNEHKKQSPVNPLYMEQPHLLKHRAIITDIGVSEVNKKKYQWIQLDETIFHPKGGGQPCDEGTINGIQVDHVHKLSLDPNRMDLFQVLHCFDESKLLNFHEGDVVELIVDADTRDLYSRMHTAGHLLAEVVKLIVPELEAIQGNHDPKNGYVRFKMLREINCDKEEMMRAIQTELDTWIRKDLPVNVTKSPLDMRAIEFAGQLMTCGGTHVDNLKQLGMVSVTEISINKKEQVVTIKYCLPDSSHKQQTK